MFRLKILNWFYMNLATKLAKSSVKCVYKCETKYQHEYKTRSHYETNLIDHVLSVVVTTYSTDRLLSESRKRLKLLTYYKKTIF